MTNLGFMVAEVENDCDVFVQEDSMLHGRSKCSSVSTLLAEYLRFGIRIHFSIQLLMTHRKHARIMKRETLLPSLAHKVHRATIHYRLLR
jgi:hypothetical protein